MVALYLLFPVACFFLAKSRGRNPWIALLLGFLVFPVILYAFLPPKGRLKPISGRNDRSTLTKCDGCGEMYMNLDDNCPSCGSPDKLRLTIGEVQDSIKRELGTQKRKRRKSKD
jgi:hypothetical protein